MFNAIFEETIDLIKRWQSKQQYGDENQYRDDLIEFLRDRFKTDMFGSQRNITIKKEASRQLCDIGIGKFVGIELKKDLSAKSEVDRLGGQLIKYRKEYEDLIVVLVGKTNPDAFEELKETVNELRRNPYSYPKEPRIGIIDKGTTGKISKPKDPFNFSQPKYKW
jgi:hypothetical protein